MNKKYLKPNKKHLANSNLYGYNDVRLSVQVTLIELEEVSYVRK